MLSVKQIQNLIPHRQPFLFVDRIEELEPGKKAVGRKCVTMNEPYFQGHFPEKPVMPGVIIIEALAQTGAVVMLSVEGNQGKIPYFAGIDQVKFKRQVVPGDILKLEVEIMKSKGNFGVGKAVAYVEDQVAVEAILTFSIQ